MMYRGVQQGQPHMNRNLKIVSQGNLLSFEVDLLLISVIEWGS